MHRDRTPLAQLPTPLHRLDVLSRAVGADIWAKRDDLTGFGMGGNKVRKAEYLIADALHSCADAIITLGSEQSNHVRVIAAAACRHNLACHLILNSADGDGPARGNLLLDKLAGARVHKISSVSERRGAITALVSRLRESGRTAYVIPIGGSNAIGAQGYVDATAELAAQLAALPPRPTTLLFATSSGGTMAGLLAGRHVAGLDVGVMGIRVDADEGAAEGISFVARDAAQARGFSYGCAPEDVPLVADYVGEGYGIATPECIQAIRQVYRQEGIVLDPVYTGKAMAGLIDLAHKGAFDGRRVVFIHTGGEPSLFAADAITIDALVRPAGQA